MTYGALAIIDCVGEGDTCSFNDRFLVVTQDQEILANCVSREVAEKLRAVLADGEKAQPEKST